MECFFVVSQWDGRTFKIVLSQTNNFQTIQVGKLKRKLTKMLGITNEELYMVHNGLLLDDHLHGTEFGLKPGDIIFLFKRQTRSLNQGASPITQSFHPLQISEDPLQKLDQVPSSSDRVKNTTSQGITLFSGGKPPLYPTSIQQASSKDGNNSEKLLTDADLEQKELDDEQEMLLRAIQKKKDEISILDELTRDKEAMIKQESANAQLKFQSELDSIENTKKEAIGFDSFSLFCSFC